MHVLASPMMIFTNIFPRAFIAMSLPYKTHPIVQMVGFFDSQRINGNNGLSMRVNMSSLASQSWSGGLSKKGGGRNYRLWNGMRTLQRMAIVLALILRSWRKVYSLIILLEGFSFKITRESTRQRSPKSGWNRMASGSPNTPHTVPI